jgi:nucleoside-diphosphate-sugar epimerase
VPKSVTDRDVNEICGNNLVPWKRFAGKTVLISGANGMLPSYLVYTLLRLNNSTLAHDPVKVIALCRSRERAEKVFVDYIDRSDFGLLIQDVCHPVEVDGPLHFIIHAASQASPKYYGVDPLGTLDANVLGTRNLLYLAHLKNSEGFLFISSSEVYGMLPGKTDGIREDQFGHLNPMIVRSCYAESKRLGETLCTAWQHQHGVPATVARPFHTYGPSMRLDDGRVYADFVANIVRDENIVLNSDGRAQRAFCYVTDATIAFFLILLSGKPGQAYNVGNPTEEISMLGLAQTLVGLFPEKKLEASTMVLNKPGYIPSGIDRNLPDISKLEGLGWRPEVCIADGFKRVVEHFIEAL